MSDMISRQEALSFLRNWERVKDYSWGERNIIKATINEIESLPSAQPEPCEDCVSREAAIDAALSAFSRGLLASPDIRKLPSVQPDGWLEQNKDKILQAGMEGREIDFRIGGRLFAIREKAQ